MNMAVLIRLICIVFFLTILPMIVHALTPAQVFDKVKNTVVVVKTFDTQNEIKSQGSGVLISPGRVSTNCHVVEGGASYRVGRGSRFVSATLYAEDTDKDICILAAKDIAGKPARFGKAADLRVGDSVFAVGAPFGLELSLSEGIVAQLRGGPPPLIQTTAAISPGSSGGGLFDGEGCLVGLTTLYLQGGQSLNFAMPVEWIGNIKPGSKPVDKKIGRTGWEKRAVALENMRDWYGLLDWCRQWTKIDPKNSDSWFGLGNAYDSLSRHNDAIEAYRESLRIDPKSASTWCNLGNVYINLKRYNDAIEAYRESLRIDPKSANTWYVLGNAYDSLSRHNDAIEAYRESLRIDPKSANTWNNLAIAYTLSGNRAAALDVIRKLRSMDVERADELFNLIVPH